MDDEALVMRTMLRYSPKVIENITIDTVPKVLYHISPVDSIDAFVPRPVKRSMPKEDKTVNRVCTAGTVLDCIRGYAVTVSDFLEEVAGCAGNNEWRGGYYIYAIPVEINVKVTEALAPIAKWCDERWLVDYKQKEQPYPAQVVGRMFYRNAKGESFAEVEILIHIEDDVKGLIPFTDRISLGKGCHSVTVADLDAYYKKGNTTRVIRSKSIPMAEYLKAKKVKADLLSYTPPSWLAWD